MVPSPESPKLLTSDHFLMIQTSSMLRSFPQSEPNILCLFYMRCSPFLHIFPDKFFKFLPSAPPSFAHSLNARHPFAMAQITIWINLHLNVKIQNMLWIPLMQIPGFQGSSRTGDVGNNKFSQLCDLYHLLKNEYNVTSFNIMITYCYLNIKYEKFDNWNFFWPGLWLQRNINPYIIVSLISLTAASDWILWPGMNLSLWSFLSPATCF